ncbi:MAG: type II toxin-antitoxin system VapC family toxin [Rhodothermia bacterium]
MTAVDSSIVVAAFASWHEAHETALVALSKRPKLPSHVAIESYSVLTRLPPPNRAPAPLVNQFLKHHFPEPTLSLPPSLYASLLELASDEAILGGSIYDALIAATALHSGATLYTLDRRAARTYQLVGVTYELV